MPTVHLTHELHEQMQRHLFSGDTEQVAFAFADWEESRSTLRLRSVELIPSSGFAFQSDYHVELEHDEHARIIKAAFDRQACLVEFHSHRSDGPARFSSSDLNGFDEFVPHVRWRLGGRPYAAIVWHETSFDGLLWTGPTPVQLDGIQIEKGLFLKSTGLTMERLQEIHDHDTF